MHKRASFLEGRSEYTLLIKGAGSIKHLHSKTKVERWSNQDDSSDFARN
jgi:hypothetical protein